MTDLRPLAEMRILVTRPQDQAGALMTMIEQQGGQAFHFPLLAISGLTDAAQQQACKTQILALDEYQHVIFVSTNAVRYGVEWIDQYWPQLPVGIAWHGIGGSTCSAMAAAGIPTQRTFDAAHPMNSEALLEHAELQSLVNQKVLIVRGIGGREHLQQQLSQRGARVDIAECYQRSAPQTDSAELLELINREHIGTICINSGDSLGNLCDVLADQLTELGALQLVVPSQRVASLAAARGFSAVTVASNASDSAVLQALIGVAMNNH